MSACVESVQNFTTNRQHATAMPLIGCMATSMLRQARKWPEKPASRRDHCWLEVA